MSQSLVSGLEVISCGLKVVDKGVSHQTVTQTKKAVLTIIHFHLCFQEMHFGKTELGVFHVSG